MQVRRLIVVAMLAESALVALGAAGQAVPKVCTDGTPAAIGGRGSCSDHGGVDLRATQLASRAAAHSALRITAVSTGDIGRVADPGVGGVDYHLPVVAKMPRATPPPTPFQPNRTPITAPRIVSSTKPGRAHTPVTAQVDPKHHRVHVPRSKSGTLKSKAPLKVAHPHVKAPALKPKGQ